MLKETKLVLFLASFVIFTSCTSGHTQVSETATITRTPLPTPGSISTSTQEAPSPCKESDLAQASKSIKTTFKDGRLETIQLEDNNLLGGDLVLSPDGSRVAIEIFGNNDDAFNGVYIFSLTDGQLLCLIPNTNRNVAITGFAFDSDGSTLAAIYYDGSILLRDSSTGQIIGELGANNYQSGFGRISFNLDDSLVATSGYFQPVRVWNLDTRELVYESDVNSKEKKSSNAALSPDGKLVAEVISFDKIRVVKLSSGETQAVMEYSSDERYVLFSNDDNFIYSLNNNSEVSVWDSHTGSKIQTLNLFTEKCTGYCEWEVETRLALSADGARLLMEDPSRVILWDTKTWTELLNGRNKDVEQDAPIVDASVNADGTMIAVNYRYGGFRFWYLAP